MLNIVNVNTRAKTVHVEAREGSRWEESNYEWISTDFTPTDIIIKGAFLKRTSEFKTEFKLVLPRHCTNYMEY